MLQFINENCKNYEYLIKALGTFLPFLITIFMAYIAYQQWLVNKSLEAFNVRQNRYQNFDIPLQKIGKLVIETFVSDDKNVDKKNTYKNCINEILLILEKNYYIFKEDDYKLLQEAFKNLNSQFDKLKPMEKSTLKELWENVKVFFSCLSIISALLFPYFTPAVNSLNIYDLIKILIFAIIKFITPHWIRRKIKKWFLPKFFLFVIVLGILLSLLNPFNIFKIMSKKNKKSDKCTQLKLFNQIETMSNDANEK